MGLWLRVADYEPKAGIGNERSIQYLGGFDGFARAGDLVDGVLLGLDGEVPDDSAVESITWGRIKAQFVK